MHEDEEELLPCSGPPPPASVAVVTPGHPFTPIMETLFIMDDEPELFVSDHDDDVLTPTLKKSVAEEFRSATQGFRNTKLSECIARSSSKKSMPSSLSAVGEQQRAILMTQQQKQPRDSACLGTQKFCNESSPSGKRHLTSVSQPVRSVSPQQASSKQSSPSCSLLLKKICPFSTFSQAPWTLGEWGMPADAVRIYEQEFGVKKLFAWQRACLFEYYSCVVRILSAQCPSASCNLLYSAPTSGGKTLVAEVILFRRLLQMEGKKAMFIVPYISIAEEKAAALQLVAQAIGKRVRCHAGSKGQRSLSDDIMVCTPEKANILLNLMTERSRLDELCVVVVDELHQIGDSGGERGYLLELLMTKLIVLSREGPLHLVALSATLSNSAQLAAWMNGAYVFTTDFRPTPLAEFVVVRGDVQDSRGRSVRMLSGEPAIERPYVLLACEGLLGDFQCLLFCPSRAATEKCAVELFEWMGQMSLSCGPRLAAAAKGRQSIQAQLAQINQQCQATSSLSRLVGAGIAFHHAALSIEERQLVEKGFREGAVWALFCTTTLATGVNLPARRVVFTAPRIAHLTLDAARYKQAAGRAGRTGMDTHGEAFVCCRPNEKQLALGLISSSLPPIVSNFSQSRRGMMRVLLDGISSKKIRSVLDIEANVKQTLLAAMSDYSEVFAATKLGLEFLEANELISWDDGTASFAATLLGEATVASSLAPDEALVVFNSMLSARNHFMFCDDTHLVYFCTPIFHGIEPDWNMYQRLVAQLPPSSHQVMALLGICESYLMQCTMAPPPRSSTNPVAIAHRRFYGTMILVDAIKEIPLSVVVSKYAGLSRQELQKLMESAATFASMVSAFCETLNWWHFPPLFAGMATRLHRGVEPDIVPLMKIQGLVPWRARELFKRGYKTVLSVACAAPRDLESVLSVKAPFEQSKIIETDLEFGLRIAGPSSLKDLVTMLQKGAKVALAEEAASLADAIRELGDHAAVDDLLVDSRKRQRSPDRVDHGGRAANGMGNDESAVGSDGVLAWEWLSTRSPSAAWDRARDIVAASGLVAISSITPWKSSHPVFVIHCSIASEETANRLATLANSDAAPTEYAAFVDDGCLKSSDELRDQHLGMKFLSSLLASEGIVKVMTPCKESLLALLRGGWLGAVGNLHSAARCVEDPLIADWLLAPEDRIQSTHKHQSISAVADKFGQTKNRPHLVAVVKDGVSRAVMIAQVLFACAGGNQELPGPFVKALAEVRQMTWLTKFLHNRLEHSNMMASFRSIEMPTALCLVHMEYHGIAFTRLDYEDKLQKMKRKVVQLTEEAFRVSGQTNWSLSSPRDCARILFDVLKLPCLERTFESKYLPKRGGARKRERIAKESRSTKASVLKALETLFPDQPLPSIIREFRTMSGWQEKFIEPLLIAAELDIDTEGKVTKRSRRICGDFFQTCTATGRLAMGEPNLQTIPHPITFLMSDSNRVEEVELRLRDAFVARDGHLLISADYKQIEARVLAHLSRDEALTRCFASGDDIFTTMAQTIFKKSVATEAERKQAKALCYGMIYGKGSHSIADDLEIPTDEAESILVGFRDAFPRAVAYTTEVALEAQHRGYVETITGRKRWLPYAASNVPKFKSATARIAVNTVCQGSAADIVKTAMIRLLQSPPFTDGPKPSCKLLLQIHDELLIEYRCQKGNELNGVEASVLADISRIMMEVTAPFQLRVPFPVKISVGRSWGRLEVVPH